MRKNFLIELFSVTLILTIFIVMTIQVTSKARETIKAEQAKISAQEKINQNTIEQEHQKMLQAAFHKEQDEQDRQDRIKAEEESAPYQITFIQIQRDHDIRLFTLINRKTQQNYLLTLTPNGSSIIEITK